MMCVFHCTRSIETTFGLTISIKKKLQLDEWEGDPEAVQVERRMRRDGKIKQKESMTNHTT